MAQKIFIVNGQFPKNEMANLLLISLTYNTTWFRQNWNNLRHSLDDCCIF